MVHKSTIRSKILRDDLFNSYKLFLLRNKTHTLNPLNFGIFQYFFIWSSSLKRDQNIPKMATTIESPYTNL